MEEKSIPTIFFNLDMKTSITYKGCSNSDSTYQSADDLLRVLLE